MSNRDLYQLRKLIEAYPAEATDLLLALPFWHPGLECGELYARYDDDTARNMVKVIFSQDGDGWVDIISLKDPNESHYSHRFRVPFIGGGQSAHVRNALLLLARAIQLDNQARPQERLPIEDP